MGQDLTANLELLGLWIAKTRALQPRPAQLTLRESAALKLFELCRDHCMSIFILLKSGEGHANASALALLRSALEACVRGGWLWLGQTDDQFKLFLQQPKPPFPPKHKCLEAIAGLIPQRTLQSLKDHMSAVKDVYDDFAHGGHQQILRRFDIEDSVAKEWDYLVRTVLIYDFLAVCWIADLMRDDEVKEALPKLAEGLGVLSAIGGNTR